MSLSGFTAIYFFEIMCEFVNNCSNLHYCWSVILWRERSLADYRYLRPTKNGDHWEGIIGDMRESTERL